MDSSASLFFARSINENLSHSVKHTLFFVGTVGKILYIKKGIFWIQNRKIKIKIYEWVESFLQTILNYFYEDDYVVKYKKKSGMDIVYIFFWRLWTSFLKDFGDFFLFCVGFNLIFYSCNLWGLIKLRIIFLESIYSYFKIFFYSRSTKECLWYIITFSFWR